jgi:hypothetical protein
MACLGAFVRQEGAGDQTVSDPFHDGASEVGQAAMAGAGAQQSEH